MTDPNYTHIMVLLDRSGSMERIRHDMEGGFNQFIREQRELPGACTVSLVRFSSRYNYDRVYSAIPLSEIPPLQLSPYGQTALHDSLCRMIDEEGKFLASLPESRRPGRVLFMCISDGEENDSILYNSMSVRTRIETQRHQFKWEFLFLGSSESQLAHAKVALGFVHTVEYQPTHIGVTHLYNSVSSSIGSYRSTGKL